MVTAETTKETLFLLKDCILCKFIELVTRLLPLPPKIVKLLKPSPELLEWCPTRTFPILQAGDVFISGALPIVNYLVHTCKDNSDGIVLNMKNILIGKNYKEEAKVESWLNYILNHVYPPVIELRALLYGQKKYNIRSFEFALNDLLDALKDVDDHLKLNTFLSDNKVQLGDLMLASALYGPYNDIFTLPKLEQIPNVIRVYKFVSHMKEFREIFGESTECEVMKSPEPFVEKKEEEIKEEVHKKDKKEKNNKAKQGEKKGEKKEKKGDETASEATTTTTETSEVKDKKNKKKKKEKKEGENKENKEGK